MRATVGVTGTPRWRSWRIATACVRRNCWIFGGAGDLANALLHVRRLKNGSPATHPLTGKELRALRQLQREQVAKSPFVFISERGAHSQGVAFRRWSSALVRLRLRYEDPPSHLRHACGFKLANDGVDTRTIQAYLGQINPAYGALHRAGAYPLQELVSGLKTKTLSISFEEFLEPKSRPPAVANEESRFTPPAQSIHPSLDRDVIFYGKFS